MQSSRLGGTCEGSCVCSKSFEGIPFLPCKLGVHGETGKGNAVGSYDFTKEERIELANNQAVVITDSDSKIID